MEETIEGANVIESAFGTRTVTHALTQQKKKKQKKREKKKRERGR
jgi:hypothetical protein